MADKPILFSAPMIRALLGGTKTQTRRVIMPQPKRFTPEYERQWHANAIPSGRHEGRPREWTWWEGPPHGQSLYHRADVAYAPGDRLWVREAWAGLAKMGDIPPRDWRPGSPVQYLAGPHVAGEWGHGRPGIHMPRWASRLTLIVEDVKVERLQDISRGDAMLEGCPFPNMAIGPNPRDWFRELWDSINGDRPGCTWADNPWVAAYTFRVIRANIDQVQP